MATIEKIKKANGKYSYKVRIRIEGAPHITESFPTKKEAVNFERRMEAEIRAGRYFGREKDKEIKFSEFIDRYIEKELPKNPKAYAKQKMLLTWWKSKLGNYFLCHITPSLIVELRDLLMSEKTSRKKLRTSSTTNRYLAALSRAFTIGVNEWQLIKENPVRKISRPKENKPKDRYLNEEEINKLLISCKKSKSLHLYSVVSFLLATGARKSEVLGLKISDINFENSTATFKNTKNGDIRTVHLSKPLLDILRQEKRKCVVISEYLFPSLNGQKPACIRQAWEKAVEDAGFAEDVSLHTLRHTVASQLAQRGYSALQIGHILGHKSLSMIKRYSHLSTGSTAPILDKMNDEILGKNLNDQKINVA
jgi:integrase